MTEPDRARRVNAWITTIALCLAAGALVAQLVITPIVGLANEGDFERVMLPSGFRYLTQVWDEIYYGHINRTFAIVPTTPSPDGYRTSEVPLARIARWVNTSVFSSERFDLRFLGLVQLSVLLASLGLLIRATRDLAPASQGVAALLLVFIYTDVGYVAAFNSFYPQTASVLFLLLTFGIAAEGVRRGRLTGAWLASYFLAAALFVCSKPQEAIHAPILASWGVWLAGARVRRFWRSPAIWLGAALIAIGFWYYRQSPRVTVRYVGLFHTYFHELLQNSPDPAADMAELGIPPDLRRYVGMHAYMPGAPINDPSFRARFLDVYGFRALLGFYARHPSRLVNRLSRAAPAAFGLRPPYLGNFEKSTGVPPRTLSHRFAVWSGARARLGRHALMWLGIFFAGNALAVGLVLRSAPPEGRRYLSLIVVGLVMAICEFLACSLADALDDLGRHFYAFDAMCDFVLVADAVWITQFLVRRRTRTAPAEPARL